MIGAVLAGATAGPTLARDPKVPATPPVVSGGTGVAGGGAPPGFDGGITANQRTAKQQDLSQFKARWQADADARKKGITPMRTPIMVVSDALPWTNGIHQQTNYYCVVAVVQTMAYQDIDRSYLTFGGTSVRGAQDRIYAYMKDPTDLGSDDWLARAWINQQYAARGLDWRYDGYTPPSFADFIWVIKYDITAHDEGSYIRIDLSSGSYMWRQSRLSDPDGTMHIPEHATMSIAFNDSVNSITSYDPFYAKDNSTGACRLGGTGLWACNWYIGQSRYFQAMDRAFWQNDPPMWY